MHFYVRILIVTPFSNLENEGACMHTVSTVPVSTLFLLGQIIFSWLQVACTNMDDC